METFGLNPELNLLVYRIEILTSLNKFNKSTILETLLKYCIKDSFAKRYDALFWDIEGYNW